MSSQEAADRLRITTTAELLKAVELGIVDRTEARGMLGVGGRRGRVAKLQPRRGGRFARGDVVYPFNRFSVNAQEAMKLAEDEAAAGGRPGADSGDMLVAVAHQGQGAGARALESLGVGED